MIDFSFDTNNKIVTAKFTGLIDLKVLIGALDSLNTFKAQNPGITKYNLLLDYRESTPALDTSLAAIELHDLKDKFIEACKSFEQICKAALVSDQDMESFNLFYKSLSRNIENFHFDVFFEEAEAIDWIVKLNA